MWLIQYPGSKRLQCGLQEEFGIATADSSQQSIPIGRGLGDRLAKSEGIDMANVASEVEMMRSNSSYSQLEAVL